MLHTGWRPHFLGPRQALKTRSSCEEGMWCLLRVLVLLTTDAVTAVRLEFAAVRSVNIFLSWDLEGKHHSISLLDPGKPLAGTRHTKVV